MFIHVLPQLKRRDLQNIVQNLFKTQELETALETLFSKSSVFTSFHAEHPSSGLENWIFNSGKSVFTILTFPRHSFLVRCRMVKLTKQDAQNKQHSQFRRVYNEETWRSEALTGSEIHFLQIQISILSCCKRPEGVYIL